jgi:hypothetical protein
MVIELKSKFNPGDKCGLSGPIGYLDVEIKSVEFDRTWKEFKYTLVGWDDKTKIDECYLG